VPRLNVFMAWCLIKHRDNFTFTFQQSFLTKYWLLNYVHLLSIKSSNKLLQKAFVGVYKCEEVLLSIVKQFKQKIR